jgi:hypothetical protein
MKTKIYIYTIVAFIMGACDILDENPESFISSENFYKTRSDAITAVTAAYAANKTNGDTNRNFNILGDVTSDDVSPLLNNNDRVQLDQYTHTPQNSILRETWQNFYLGITRCNAVVERVPLIQMDETLKGRLIAEAQFLRGFYYFHLVRLFGKVPLVLKETTSLAGVVYPKREEVNVVYQQIIKDFQDAESVLPISYTGADRGRATKGAAKAYLSLVYLTLKDYAKAAEKAKEVMAPEFGYGLWANLTDVFAIPNEFGKEAIFDAQFISGPSGQGSNLIAFWAQENNTIAGRGFGSFQPTEDIYNSFDPADKRLPVFFVKGTDGKYYCNKWIDADAVTANQSDNNFPHIRFAEVLLIFAEATNEVSGPTEEAYNAVNAIRERAGLADLEGLTRDEFREAVLQERRLELCFEGHRWYDLVRTGRLVSTLQAKGITNVQEYHTVFPVPQIEIDLNQNLKPQNDGYPQ